MKKKRCPDPENQFTYSVEQSTKQPVERDNEKYGGSVKKWNLSSQMRRKLLPPRRP
jgi:hypothetical protein